MHPVLARRGRIVLYLALWALFGLLLAALLAGPGLAGWRRAAALAVPLGLAYAFIALATWYPCRANPLPDTGALRVGLVHAAGALLSSALWLLLAGLWASALELTPAFAGTRALLEEQRPLFFAVGVLLYLLAAAGHYLLLAFEASQRAQSRALELKVLAREAELEAFKSQIDPHFLFNCLNSISALCGSDPAAARRMAIRLGDFLRACLKLASRDRIGLGEELQLAAAYLDVERVRLGDRLRYEERVDPACLDAPVPALLLQPLLENSLKHGIAHLLDGGTVRIEGSRHGDLLELRVENPCETHRPGGNGAGIGLANVRGRLELLYGGRARLSAREVGDSFRVRILLPAPPGEGVTS